MSWSIGEMVNTVRIPDACAKDLFAAQKYDGEKWDDPDYVTQDGLLYFNPDHSEWMDWLGSGDTDHLIAVLKKHKVRGDICFGSLEGDNAGSFWGYRFDGAGGMVPLKGIITWEEQKQTLAGEVVVVTGALDAMTRDEAHERIEEAGGTVGHDVTKRTTLLVFGDKPGSKLERARKLGIRLMGQTEFFDAIGGVDM